VQLFKPYITEEAIKAVEEVLRSGWIGLGPKTAGFEKAFAEYVGAKYAVALNSGTAALHLALLLVGVGPGDEVITTPLTFVSTNHAIRYCGATPIWADVRARTCNIDPASVVKLITPKTKAIMCVHFGGWPCDLAMLQEPARHLGITVIEDAAHACGSTYINRLIGGSGLTCFSFHAVKNLPTADGGMLTTSSRKYAERAKRLRWLGIDKDTWRRTEEDTGAYAWQYDVTEIGYKYHMNDVIAAIGLAQLKVLEAGNERRRQIAVMYSEGLIHRDIVIKMPLSDPTRTCAQHLFWIQARNRNGLIKKLKGNGIEPGVHYIPNNSYSIYGGLISETPVAQLCSERLISLPLHLGLSDEDIEKVIDVINTGW